MIKRVICVAVGLCLMLFSLIVMSSIWLDAHLLIAFLGYVVLPVCGFYVILLGLRGRKQGAAKMSSRVLDVSSDVMDEVVSAVSP